MNPSLIVHQKSLTPNIIRRNVSPQITFNQNQPKPSINMGGKMQNSQTNLMKSAVYPSTFPTQKSPQNVITKQRVN